MIWQGNESRVKAGLLVFFVCSLGCARSTTEPTPDYDITLDVQLVEETSGGVVTINAFAMVQNSGAKSVTYAAGCPRPLYFSVLDSEGNSLQLRSACEPVPDCPAMQRSLDPGESETNTLAFDGTIWDVCDEQFLPPGHFELVVDFYYWTPGSKRLLLTKSKFFDWPGALISGAGD